MKTNVTITQAPVFAAQNPPRADIRLLCHRISAGFPSPAADHADDELDLNEYLISNKSSTYMFSVKGDSMTGAGIQNGDKVVVDRSLAAGHDDIVVAVINGEFTIKRLHKRRGKIELHAENPAYAPITFAEGSELEVWGVVTGVVRRYTKKPRR